MPINSFLYPGPSNSNPYLVDNSLRFNSGSSDYLSRTPSSAGNRRTYTGSVWVKRSNLDQFNFIFDADNGSTQSQNLLFGYVNQTLVGGSIYNAGTSSTVSDVATSALYRDISAWYHLCVAIDTTQGTASDRVKIYVNGVQQTSLGTASYMDQNYETGINATCPHSIGRWQDDGSRYFNGYLAEFVFVDGQALGPTTFGEFDSDSPNIWKPKAIAIDSFGTNGFYLQFKQTGTSANSSGIGADTSGNDNHFTVNNLTAVDQSTDTCTNNFATMNPLAVTNAGNTFTEGNLKITTTSGASSYNQATIGVSSGKWYWEIKYVSDTDGSNNYARIGIADINPPNTGGLGETEGIAYEAINGKYKIRGSATSYGDTYAPGDIISVALNLDDNELIFYKNGTAQNSGTAIDISSYTSKTGFWYPAFNYDDGSNSGVFEANFGSPSFAISSGNADANGYGNFEYSVPTNYYSLCTKNLAEFGG